MYFAKSVEQDQLAHTCSRILLRSLNCSIINFCQQNTNQWHSADWNPFSVIGNNLKSVGLGLKTEQPVIQFQSATLWMQLTKSVELNCMIVCIKYTWVWLICMVYYINIPVDKFTNYTSIGLLVKCEFSSVHWKPYIQISRSFSSSKSYSAWQ